MPAPTARERPGQKGKGRSGKALHSTAQAGGDPRAGTVCLSSKGQGKTKWGLLTSEQVLARKGIGPKSESRMSNLPPSSTLPSSSSTLPHSTLGVRTGSVTLPPEDFSDLPGLLDDEGVITHGVPLPDTMPEVAPGDTQAICKARRKKAPPQNTTTRGVKEEGVGYSSE